VSVPVITIDAPSGSGKGTVARRLAETLGFHLLDSGALYRVTGHAGWLAGLDPADAVGHAAIAAHLDLVFGVSADGSESIRLHGVDIARAIRTEAGGARASAVAAHPAVRRALLERQQGFATAPGLVADGRDMGTVVFPAAVLKIFLTASAQERARRRFRQLQEAGQTRWTCRASRARSKNATGAMPNGPRHRWYRLRMRWCWIRLRWRLRWWSPRC